MVHTDPVGQATPLSTGVTTTEKLKREKWAPVSHGALVTGMDEAHLLLSHVGAAAVLTHCSRGKICMSFAC